MGVMGHTTARLNAVPWPGRLTAFMAVLAVIVLVWYAALMAPLVRHQRSLQLEAVRKQHQIAGLQAGGPGAQQEGDTSPAADKRARIAGLEFDIDKLDHRIKQLKGEMIDPRRMRTVLHSILTRNTRLTLVSIESLAPKPLVDKHAGAAREEGVHHVFMHGVRIRFKGGYPETVRYLKALEGLPWRFFWGDLDYDVTDYPEAEGSLVVYTMSMEAGWIGA